MSEFASGVSITAEKSVARRQASWAAQALGQLARDQLVLLSAVCVLGLGLRLWDIGRRSFWLDELSAVGTSALSFQDLLQALTVEANMTLYYWALFVWLRIVGFGADEGAIRLLSAVIGAVAIPLTYLLGRRLHSSAAGLAAAALLAVNGYHVLMSQEARAYALLSTLTVLSYILLDRALQSGRRRDWALHGLVTVLAFYCHFYTALTVVAQGVFVLSRRSRAALVGMGISGLVMGLLLAQLVPFFIHYSHGAKVAWVDQPRLGDVAAFFVDFSGGAQATFALYLVLGALGVALVRAGSRSTGYRNWLLLSWFLVPVGLALGISLAKPIFVDRYLFATLPALPLLAGIGLIRLARLAGVAGFVLVAALSIGAIRSGFEVRPNEQWRQAVSYALANAQPGDGWIFIQKWGQDGFEYYAGWHWGRNPTAPYEDIFERFDWRQAYNVPFYRGVISMAELERFAATHPRIWLVLNRVWDRATDVDTAAPVRGWLSRHGYGAKQREFPGARLLLYERNR